jgi:hypothetical protein
MLTQNQFEELLALEHEIPGVEFKGPGPRGDDYLRAKVARAVMGMTNRRDGGIVIIGVEERGGVLNPVGLSQNDVGSWRNNDHVINALANYMSPPASFDLSIREFQGKEFAVLEVHEFSDVPTICKKRYHRNHQSGHLDVVLREGACYIRSRHKPETVEVSSLEHMRELLDLAIEKGVRKFVTQAQKAGMHLSGESDVRDQELFDQQFANWTSPLLEKIQSRGFWKVIIRPDKFSQDKIPYDVLYPLVQRTAVDLYGDDFPNVVLDSLPFRGTDWIGQEIEAGHFLEAWNMYQSGQFVHYSGMLDDWLNQSDSSRSPEGRRLAIEEVVRQYTGIFVFASRLALTDGYAQDTHIYIDVLIKDLQGRHLYINTPGRWPLRQPYEAHIPEFHPANRFPRDELIANSTKLALQASRELFLRFGWDASLASLESTQSTFYRGS